MTRDDERGVALLTVLVMVALMAALSVALLDDIRFAIRRTTNAEAMAQARWYALGAEQLARAQITRLERSGRTDLLGDWQDRPLRFPIEGGGIEARVSDGGACFNLNSVVQGAGEVLERRDAGVRQFVALAQALGVAPATAEGLAGALVDWIDADILREPGGAEDEAYEDQSYGTAGALLAEPSELRAIRGFDAATYRRLRPYVCALPTAELSPININTLTAEKAVLLTMLTNGELPIADARQVVAQRPAAGWESVEAFWAQPLLANLSPTDEAVGQVEIRTRFFALQTHVLFADADVTASSLLENQGGRVRVVARRWGYEE